MLGAMAGMVGSFAAMHAVRVLLAGTAPRSAIRNGASST